MFGRKKNSNQNLLVDERDAKIASTVYGRMKGVYNELESMSFEGRMALNEAGARTEYNESITRCFSAAFAGMEKFLEANGKAQQIEEVWEDTPRENRTNCKDYLVALEIKGLLDKAVGKVCELSPDALEEFRSICADCGGYITWMDKAAAHFVELQEKKSRDASEISDGAMER